MKKGINKSLYTTILLLLITIIGISYNTNTKALDDNSSINRAVGETFQDHFPDQRLAAAVAGAAAKSVTDIITQNDVNNITRLTAENASITSLEGLNMFVNIEELKLGYNNISSVDLNSLTKLKKLELRNNSITSISLSGAINLKEINLTNNSLTSINTSNLPNSLEDLQLGNNHNLNTFVNNSNLSNLKILSIYNAQLSTFNASGLVSLERLDLYQNQLLTINNINNLIKLKYLSLYDNNLTSINLSALKHLVNADISQNNLEHLEVIDLPNLDYLSANSNFTISKFEAIDLPELLTLNLSYNNLTSEKLTFTNIPKLSYLLINNNKLTILDTSLFPNLAHLEMGDNQIISMNNIEYNRVSALPGSMNNQNYHSNIRNGYLNKDYKLNQVPILTQIFTYTDVAAPEFELTDPDGQTISIYPPVIDNNLIIKNEYLSKKGDYTLVANILSGRFNPSKYTLNFNIGISTPELTLKGANPQIIQEGTPYIELGYSAKDPADGNLTNKVQVNTSSLNTQKPGKYTITYTVTNSYGKTATAKREVIVTNNKTVLKIPKSGSNLTLSIILLLSGLTSLSIYSLNKKKNIQ